MDKRRFMVTQDGKVQGLISDDDKEYLKMLASSSGWQVYRKMLLDLKHGYLESAMPLQDGYKLKEVVSIAAGLNLAVNQLDTLIKVFNDAKPVAGEAQT